MAWSVCPRAAASPAQAKHQPHLLVGCKGVARGLAGQPLWVVLAALLLPCRHPRVLQAAGQRQQSAPGAKSAACVPCSPERPGEGRDDQQQGGARHCGCVVGRLQPSCARSIVKRGRGQWAAAGGAVGSSWWGSGQQLVGQWAAAGGAVCTLRNGTSWRHRLLSSVSGLKLRSPPNTSGLAPGVALPVSTPATKQATCARAASRVGGWGAGGGGAPPLPAAACASCRVPSTAFTTPPHCSSSWGAAGSRDDGHSRVPAPAPGTGGWARRHPREPASSQGEPGDPASGGGGGPGGAAGRTGACTRGLRRCCCCCSRVGVGRQQGAGAAQGGGGGRQPAGSSGGLPRLGIPVKQRVVSGSDRRREVDVGVVGVGVGVQHIHIAARGGQAHPAHTCVARRGGRRGRHARCGLARAVGLGMALPRRGCAALLAGGIWCRVHAGVGAARAGTGEGRVHAGVGAARAGTGEGRVHAGVGAARFGTGKRGGCMLCSPHKNSPHKLEEHPPLPACQSPWWMSMALPDAA